MPGCTWGILKTGDLAQQPRHTEQRVWCRVLRKNGCNLFQVHGTFTGCHRRPQWCPCLWVKNSKNSGGGQTAAKSNIDKGLSMKGWPWKLDINTQKNYEHHILRNSYVRLDQGLSPHKQPSTQKWNTFSLPLTLPHILEELGPKWRGRGSRKFWTKNLVRSFNILNFNIWNWSEHSRRFPRCH